ncbi:MAG: hypothetical protein WC655_09175 [Candidatus Hydrogenedentales bacterium]
MNTRDNDEYHVCIGGFPFAEAPMGVWMTPRNGDTFAPVPAVAYAGDLLFSAAERVVRRVYNALAQVVNNALEDSASQEELAGQVETIASAEPPVTVSNDKAA